MKVVVCRDWGCDRIRKGKVETRESRRLPDWAVRCNQQAARARDDRIEFATILHFKNDGN
jgi:hypothetical protein